MYQWATHHKWKLEVLQPPKLLRQQDKFQAACHQLNSVSRLNLTEKLKQLQATTVKLSRKPIFSKDFEKSPTSLAKIGLCKSLYFFSPLGHKSVHWGNCMKNLNKNSRLFLFIYWKQFCCKQKKNHVYAYLAKEI